MQAVLNNNKLTLKTKQRFKSERRNVFTEEINKIALSLDDGKWVQLIDSIEAYAYGTNKDLVSEKEKTKFNNMIKCKKMINFHDVQKKT